MVVSRFFIVILSFRLKALSCKMFNFSIEGMPNDKTE